MCQSYFPSWNSPIWLPMACPRSSGPSVSRPPSWNLRISPIFLWLRPFVVSAVASKIWIVELSGVRKFSFFQIFRGILVTPRMDSDSEHPPGSGGIQLLGGGSLFQKFYPKIVAEVQPGVKVTVREKNQKLEFPGRLLPDAKKYFS